MDVIICNIIFCFECECMCFYMYVSVCLCVCMYVGGELNFLFDLI